jgi:hypothetical protein
LSTKKGRVCRLQVRSSLQKRAAFIGFRIEVVYRKGGGLWVSGLKKSTEEGRVYRLQVRGTEEGRVYRLQARSSLQKSIWFVCRPQVRSCLQKGL